MFLWHSFIINYHSQKYKTLYINIPLWAFDIYNIWVSHSDATVLVKQMKGCIVQVLFIVNNFIIN